MPATYAHYRLGQEVRRSLTGIARKAVEAYPQLYMIGLHGPDILFYYKPLGGGEINKEGSRIHDRSGRAFFERAAEVIRAHRKTKSGAAGKSMDNGKTTGNEKAADNGKSMDNGNSADAYRKLTNDEAEFGNMAEKLTGTVDMDDRQKKTSDDLDYDLAYLSYAYGYICHFALDVTCHGYIGEVEKSGLTHSEIESEFDRELMVIDGIEPVSHRLTDHLVPSLENGRVIAEFYSVSMKPEDAEKAVKGMIFYSNVFLSPSRVKRWFVDLALRISGHYRWLHGMMINYKKNPACDESCRKLKELYGNAKELAVRLIGEYQDYLEGRKPLDDIYAYNFESVIPSV